MPSWDEFFYNEKYAASARSSDDKIVIDFSDVYDLDPNLGLKLVLNPLKGFDELRANLWLGKRLDGDDVEKKIRIINLVETTHLRSINETHIGQLIQVEGIIVSTSAPEPEPVTAAFKCPQCGAITYEHQSGFVLRTPRQCDGNKCKNKKFGADDIDRYLTKYKYVQLIELQERPEELPPGEIPESLSIYLQDDLIRLVTPGDRARIVGILEAIPKNPRKLGFSKILVGNSIIVENKDFNIDLTNEDLTAFSEIASDPDAVARMVESFAPGIFGWNHVKEALLEAQFGGVAKSKGDLDVRGNINILMLGDAGTAKSQLLRYSHKLAHRCIFSTGRGVTGVGLTAAVVREDDRFVLRAGSMALADMGVCCIDEGEKMRKEDRDSIHTPMEQQIIPVQKGGLNTTLNARCATLMACNPTEGRYNIYKTIPENIKDFPETLLSRFDFIFVMPDVSTEEGDEEIANRVLQLEESNPKKKIPFTTLKKYIIYSKRFNPTIPKEIGKKLKEYFLQKRREQRDSNELKITWRQLESLERSCEARARAHLRDTVTMEDAEATMRLFEMYVKATWTDPYTGKIDMNVYEGIPPSSRQQQADYVPNIIEHMYRDGKGIPDALGELFVRRGDLIKELERLGQLDTFIANKVLDLAIEKDLIWAPGIDKIKIKGDRNKAMGDDPQTLNT